MTDDTALERLTAEMARCPYHAFLKPEAVAADAAAGRVVVRLSYRPEFRAAYDSAIFHGGIIAALVDIAGHAAIAVQTGRQAPTVDLRVDYLRPATGAALIATGRALRVGRALGRADVEVADPGGVVVAVGRGTFSTLEG